jgi:hypothetical protein
MDALKGLGYPHIVINGQKMHHGVAILSKVPLVEDRSHDWQDNGEARHIGVRLPNGVLLENVYVPAGGDIPDREQNPKFGQKLDFLGRMIDWSSSLSEPTILTGDFNIAPLDPMLIIGNLSMLSATRPLKSRRLPACKRVTIGSISDGISCLRRSVSSPGGATAQRIGRFQIAADALITCGRPRPCANRQSAIQSMKPVAIGTSLPTIFPS